MNCQKDKIWRITLDTNPEHCNYHCIMCEEHSRYSSFKERLKASGVSSRLMPKEWLGKIFEQAHQLGISEVIPSTMGEPLLYSGIEEFYGLAKKYGMTVNLTTNGSFPGKTLEEWAELIIPQTSDVKVSINGATREVSEPIMVGSNFDRQISGIKTLVAYRDKCHAETGHYCSITMQLTFMQNNMHQLADIVKLASELDVDRIKGHHLWTHFDEIRHLSMKDSPESIAKWNGYVDEAYQAQDKYRKKNGEKIRLENIAYLEQDKGTSVPEESECPFLNRELWVSATGKISPCCAPDNLRATLGDFGNIKTDSLTDVVNGSKYQNLVANYKENELCKTCNMRR